MDIPSELEQVVEKVKSGELTIDYLVDSFLQSTIAVPSSSDPTEGGISPVLTDIEGAPYMVVASSAPALNSVSDVASFAVTLTGAQVLSGVDERFGILLHTQSDAVSLSPELLGEVRAALSA